ncbi:hypothetical protein [Actinoplanes sp. L3-i22]|uniref:hypothetical protein n=1 Tax=Actinoplanes sp. L3-i22 TaxID=2836373 RepID=UPI001C74915B|nr:hypothetical protein [Actinoplanes sp. L3-i22]BCY12005.1 hypothetical protein L3i22_070930 [Actinoplanes sp. L3-i22]
MNILRQVTVAVAVVLLLGGCDLRKNQGPADNGVAALEPGEILGQAKDALDKSSSFHVAGTIVITGRTAGYDLKVSAENRLGTLTPETGSPVQMLVSGKRTYFKVDERLLAGAVGAKEAHRLAPYLAESWVEPAREYTVFAALTVPFQRDQLVKALGAVTKDERPTTYEGHPAIVLHDAGGGFTSLYVSTTGDPVPLAMTGAGGAKVVFTEYGEGFTGLMRPASGDIIVVPNT